MNLYHSIDLLRKNRYEALLLSILFIFILLYNIEWDIIVHAKILNLQASVFDLGVFYERLWIIFNHPTFSVIIGNIQNSAIVIPMSPLSLIHNPFFFVYLQTFWLSITAIPVYFIVRKELKSKFYGLIIASSFLIFFGLTGINWFDAHFQSLFIPLFVSGYALLLYGKNRSAIILLILSGLTRFPYIIFPLMLGFTYIIENYYNHDFSIKSNRVYYYLFFISLFFTIIGFIHIGSISGIVGDAHGSTNYLSNFKGSLDDKIFTFLLLLSPFLMLPLTRLRFLLLMLPFFFLSFFSGYADYYFPSGNSVQYYTLIVPFLYLGFIEALKDVDYSSVNNKLKKNYKKFKFHLDKKSRIVIPMMAIIIMLALFYEPYGPYNADTSDNFSLHSTLNYNQTFYNEYESIVQLIPKNTPYILYLDSMPGVDFRDPEAQTSYVCYVPQNHTYFINHQWTSQIDYIIVNANSYPWFTLNGQDNSVYSAFNYYILSGNYGIKAELNNIVLLEKNYTGSPVYYKPYNVSHNYNTPIVINNTTPDTCLLYLQALQPGNYNFTIQVKTNNISKANYDNLDFTYLYENNYKNWTKFNAFNISSEKLCESAKWVNLSFQVDVPLELVGASITSTKYHGTDEIAIKSINIIQLKP